MSQRQKNLPQKLFRFPLAQFPSFWENLEDELSTIDVGQSDLTISSDDKNLYVEAGMPGLDPKQIDVTIENGILIIRGERQEEEENKDRKYYRKASSSFSYRLALPDHIDDSSEPKAEYKDGILKLTFKKSIKSQTRKIQIK